ncbi:SNF1-interacting protein [Lecanora helva]
MGNSATKEQKSSGSRLRSSDSGQASSPAASSPQSPSFPPPNERNPSHPIYNVRTGRGSRSDLSTFLGIRNGSPAEMPTLETRRVNKQEREAKKLEMERIAREKERARSMREEHVDGGYLVTQGVYTGPEDYNKGIVRQLMIERRIAPFWRGLNDHSDSWTENQLVAAARGKPVPPPDAIPEEEPKGSSTSRSETTIPESTLNNLTVPITSRSQSLNSDSSSNISPSQSSNPQGSTATSAHNGTTAMRSRAKTLASLTTPHKNQQNDSMPREMQLPKDPFVNGQPIEAFLYKDASECPICFLYYPPHLNRTRCCDQAICSECFVQIKRPDPHPPEHADPSLPPPPPSTTEQDIDPEELISEPAACPFCVQPEFGITYDPPRFRRGLTYLNHPSSNALASAPSAMSSASSLGSAHSGRLSPTGSSRRRATSLSATAPTVITTDRVRPDWHQKLAAARAHTARRSAAATALHTAAYLMGNRQEQEGRTLSFGRRGILRRTTGSDGPSGTNSSQMNMLALMSERYAAANASREESEPMMTPGPRGSSRRNRVDDLEEMMMMEAIRLSLASEEDRRKREEKETRKDQKKKEKQSKKASKAARKAGGYPPSANQSTSGVDGSFGEASISQGDLIANAGKGKSPQQDIPNTNFSSLAAGRPQEHLERARAQILPGDAANNQFSSSPYRPSHLRTLSNASSTASSMEGSKPASLTTDHHGQSSSFDVSPNASGVNIPSAVSTQDTFISGTPPGGGAGMEPMFNFRSLAAMVGDDDTPQDMNYENDKSATATRDLKAGESSSSTANKGDSEERDIPSINSFSTTELSITPSPQVESDLGSVSEDRKHAAIEIENTSSEGPQAST